MWIAIYCFSFLSGFKVLQSWTRVWDPANLANRSNIFFLCAIFYPHPAPVFEVPFPPKKVRFALLAKLLQFNTSTALKLKKKSNLRRGTLIWVQPFFCQPGEGWAGQEAGPSTQARKPGSFHIWFSLLHPTTTEERGWDRLRTSMRIFLNCSARVLILLKESNSKSTWCFGTQCGLSAYIQPCGD